MTRTSSAQVRSNVTLIDRSCTSAAPQDPIITDGNLKRSGIPSTSHPCTASREPTVTDWEIEARPVAPELTADYDHADYLPEPTHTERMSGIPLADRLDEVMRTRLHELMGAL